MNEEERQPKISLPEAVFAGTLLFLLPDVIEFSLIFIGLDDFWISDAFSFTGSQIYLRMKGVKATYSLVTSTIELIPYVGWLPLRTIGFGITYWADHHPRAAGALTAATAVTGGAKAVSRGTTAAPSAPTATGATAEVGAGARTIAEQRTPLPQPLPGPKEAGAAPTRPPSKEISEEAMGEEKPILEKLKEPLKELPTVALNEGRNEVDLRGLHTF